MKETVRINLPPNTPAASASANKEAKAATPVPEAIPTFLGRLGDILNGKLPDPAKGYEPVTEYNEASGAKIVGRIEDPRTRALYSLFRETEQAVAAMGDCPRLRRDVAKHGAEKLRLSLQVQTAMGAFLDALAEEFTGLPGILSERLAICADWVVVEIPDHKMCFPNYRAMFTDTMGECPNTPTGDGIGKGT